MKELSHVVRMTCKFFGSSRVRKAHIGNGQSGVIMRKSPCQTDVNFQEVTHIPSLDFLRQKIHCLVMQRSPG